MVLRSISWNLCAIVIMTATAFGLFKGFPPALDLVLALTSLVMFGVGAILRELEQLEEHCHHHQDQDRGVNA